MSLAPCSRSREGSNWSTRCRGRIARVGRTLRISPGGVAGRLAKRRDWTETGIVREIVFDTETTGLEFSAGHRLIEVGCVELLNHIPTGRTFHAYINPRRSVSADA